MFWVWRCYGLLWILHCHKDRYCDVTMIWPLLFHGIRAGVSETPSNALTTRMRGDYRPSIDSFFVGFHAICYAFLRINPISIEGRNCSFSTVPVLFNKCSGLRPSDTLSSWWLGWRRHARMGKPFCGKSLDLLFQSLTIVLLTIYLYWMLMISFYRICSQLVRCTHFRNLHRIYHDSVVFMYALYSWMYTYICCLHLYILLCSRVPWRKSLTELLTCIDISYKITVIRNGCHGLSCCYCVTHVTQLTRNYKHNSFSSAMHFKLYYLQILGV